MKNTFLTLIAFSFPILGMAQTETHASEMYIIPVDADGKVNFTGSSEDGDTVADYPDKMPMTPNADGTFSISDTEIEYGFYILGNNDKDGTLYTLNSWAVSPPVQIGPNPLQITTHETGNYIPVANGVYDIIFMPRSVTNARLNMFSITQKNVEHLQYPSEIYLFKDGVKGQNTTVPGYDGIYTYVLPDATGSLIISYEPRNDYPSFIYRPVEENAYNLIPGEKVYIQRNSKTAKPFTYTAREGVKTTATISIVPGDEYIILEDFITTGIDESNGVVTEPETDEAYYTLSGTKVNKKTAISTPGIYIIRGSAGARKLIIAK